MARPVHICVCCGGGIFTTTVVTEEIEKLLKSKKIPYQVSPHKITEIPNLTEADIIVATGKTQAANKNGAPVLIETATCLPAWAGGIFPSCWTPSMRLWATEHARSLLLQSTAARARCVARASVQTKREEASWNSLHKPASFSSIPGYLWRHRTGPHRGICPEHRNPRGAEEEALGPPFL